MSSQDTGVSGASSTKSDVQNAGLPIDEQGVADYLRKHPEFFEDKPSLLSDLRVPHNAGGAVSLVERQVNTLRESNENRQAQLDALIQIARDNDRLNFQLHQLTLQLMECSDLGGMLAVISNRLQKDFEADLMAVRLLPQPLLEADSNLPEFVADVDVFRDQFQRLLGTSKPYCGHLKPEQLKVLFGDHADAIGSSAVLPLGEKGAIGLLVIGSFERDRFSANVDTAFLRRMAEIINAVLIKHLKKSDD